MTFKTLISHSGSTHGTSFGESLLDNGFKKLNRDDYPHGWKGGNLKGGSAVNAITLLAFLFFLNLLQTCLRDNLAATQTPIVVVMTEENVTTQAVNRTKRSEKIKPNLLFPLETQSPEINIDSKDKDKKKEDHRSLERNTEPNSNKINCRNKHHEKESEQFTICKTSVDINADTTSKVSQEMQETGNK